MTGIFRLLSDKTRLNILMLLANGERNVTSLCEELQLSAANRVTSSGFASDEPSDRQPPGGETGVLFAQWDGRDWARARDGSKRGNFAIRVLPRV